MRIDHISDTARWVAYYRAVEHDRPDAVFRDPYARRLAGERGAAIASALHRRSRAMSWIMAVRTVAIDELLVGAVALGATRVVNLAAGMDSRPWRLQLPASLRWIDVDLPAILDEKTETMRDVAPSCRYEAQRVDLTNDAERQALFSALASAPAPTVFVTEGLLVYLTPDQVAALAREIHAVPQANWWLVDSLSPGLLRMMQRSLARDFGRSVSMHFAPPEGLRFFARYGWKVGQFLSVGAIARRIGRSPSFFRTVRWMLKMFFMSRRRRAAMRQMIGYARLDRA